MDSTAPSLNNAISITNKRITNLQTEIGKLDVEIAEYTAKALQSKKEGFMNTAKMYYKSKLLRDKRKQQLVQYIQEMNVMRGKLQAVKTAKAMKTAAAKGGKFTRKAKRSKRRSTRRL